MPSEEKRLNIGTALLCLAIIAHMAMSLNLWVGDRLFPKIPAFEGLPSLSFVPEILLMLLVVAALGWLAFQPFRGKVVLGIVLLLPIICLFDQMRMQPWLYLFWLLLLPLALRDRNSDTQTTSDILTVQRLTIVGLYVWSGIHKLQPEYFEYVHPWILAPLEEYLPGSVHQMLVKAAHLAPMSEIALGILLVLRRTRNIACIGLGIMHLFLLLCLGPLGQNWNSVVWPWNIAMTLFVFLYFFKSDWKPSLSTLLRGRAKVVGAAVLTLALVAPTLNLVGTWDNYFSFTLYSGKTKTMYIYFMAEAVPKLNEQLQDQLIDNPNAPGYKVLPADEWSMNELGVPVYPERRVQMDLSRAFCDTQFTPQEVFFVISNRSGTEVEQFRCNQLED